MEVEKTEAEYRKLSPDKLTGEIEIRNLDFRYGKRKQVLENINLKIEKGQKVAFVGESGSGKPHCLNCCYICIQRKKEKY